MSENLINVTGEEKEDDQYLPAKQSANTLFRFFEKPKYLYSALKRSALIPRYYEENVDYLDIGYHQIAYPMICFCDINIHKLEEHMKFYGKYGIAFSKAWGIAKGVQPIQYINNSSVLCQDFKCAFNEAIDSASDSSANNFLLTHLHFIKPISGKMMRAGKEISRNFTDECEWRYIPDVQQIDIPQIIIDENLPAKSLLNETLESNECCWLRFLIEDIKYLTIATTQDFIDICQVIDSLELDEMAKKRLFSKILIWQETQEDF